MTDLEKENALEKNKEISFNNKLAAEKKPYFFGYIYSKYMDEHKKHKSNYKKMCKLMYHCNLHELIQKQDKTEEEKQLVKNYYRHMPLMVNNCPMNILANYVEDTEFDNKWKQKPSTFDYHILMSDSYDIEDKNLYKKVKETITSFTKSYGMLQVAIKQLGNIENSGIDKEDIEDFDSMTKVLIETYENKLFSLDSNKIKLCNYVIDVYYKCFNKQSKMMLWTVFGDCILSNLKQKTDKVYYPVSDNNGVDYLGKRYSLKEVDNIGNNI